MTTGDADATAGAGDRATDEPLTDGEWLDLRARDVDVTDAEARTATRDALESLAAGPAGTGRLGGWAEWLAGVQGQSPPRPPGRARLVAFAADHGIAALGVSNPAAGTTAEQVRAFVSGRAPAAALAASTGVGVRLVDVGLADDVAGAPADVSRLRVRAGSGRLDVEDTLTRDEVRAAWAAGAEVADLEVDAGADLLVAVDLGAGSTSVAATLVGLLTDRDVLSVLGRGSGIDDATWIRKCGAVRDGMRRGRERRGDVIGTLAAVGGPSAAALAGFVLQAAVRRTPVVLDSPVAAAVALLVRRLSFRAPLWWQAAARGSEPAQSVAVDELGLEPLTELGLGALAGVAGVLSVPALRAAAELASHRRAG